jgi:hypothetical protein
MHTHSLKRGKHIQMKNGYSNTIFQQSSTSGANSDLIDTDNDIIIAKTFKFFIISLFEIFKHLRILLFCFRSSLNKNINLHKINLFYLFPYFFLFFLTFCCQNCSKPPKTHIFIEIRIHITILQRFCTISELDYRIFSNLNFKIYKLPCNI